MRQVKWDDKRGRVTRKTPPLAPPPRGRGERDAEEVGVVRRDRIKSKKKWNIVE